MARQVHKMVEDATAEVLMAEDWEKNLALCDVAMMYPDEAPREICKALEKRVSHKNPKVQMLALSLAETLVKNCNFPLHKHISDRSFQKTLLKTFDNDVKKRNGRPSEVGEKVLELVQEWAEAFGRFADTLPGFQESFDALEKKNVQFPARNMDAMVPIHTPPASHPVHQQPFPQPRHAPAPGTAYNLGGYGGYEGPPAPAGGPPVVTPERVAKGRSDLDQVANQMKIFHEIMSSCAGPQEVLESEICSEMRSTAIEMKKRLVHLIEGGAAPEELLGTLFEVNDQADFAIERYEKIVSGQPDPLGTAPGGGAGGDSRSEELIPGLGSGGNQGGGGRGGQAPANSLDELFGNATLSPPSGGSQRQGADGDPFWGGGGAGEVGVGGGGSMGVSGVSSSAVGGGDEFDELVSHRRRATGGGGGGGGVSAASAQNPFEDPMAMPPRGPPTIPGREPPAPQQQRPPASHTNPVVSSNAPRASASSSGGNASDSDEEFDSFLKSRVSTRQQKAKPVSDKKQDQMHKEEEDFFGL